MYDNGQGVPQDYKTAVKWYRLAAEQGHAAAQNNLRPILNRMNAEKERGEIERLRETCSGFGFKDGLRYRNIVSSQYIADAQIEFVSKGSLNDAQKESWYQRLASIVNPF